MPANNISITDYFLAQQIVRTTYDSGTQIHTPWQNAKLQVSNTDIAANNPVWTMEPDAAGAGPVVGTGSANIGATGNLFAFDTTGYESIAIHVTNSGNASTIEYKGSDDNSHWFQVVGEVEANVAGGGPTTSRTSTATGGLVFPLKYRYFLANVSTYTGSVNVAVSYALRKSPVTIGSTWVNNSNTNPVPVIQVASTIQAVTVAANTTSQILIAPNTDRTGILIQNQGAGNVAIVPQGGGNTTAAFGTDGSMILLVDASLEFDKAIQDGFNCITDTGTSNVAVWEF